MMRWAYRGKTNTALNSPKPSTKVMIAEIDRVVLFSTRRLMTGNLTRSSHQMSTARKTEAIAVRTQI